MSTFKPIIIHFKWDRENFLKAFNNAYNFEFKNSIRRYIGWFFIAMTQFGVVFALKGGRVALLMLSTILVVYWYYIKKLMVKKRVLKEFEKSPLKDKVINIKIGKDTIIQDGESISWDNIDAVVPSGDDILLYINKRAYFIPFGAFDSIEEKSRFKALAKEKGKLYV